MLNAMEGWHVIQRNPAVKKRTFRFVTQTRSALGSASYENRTEALIRQTWLSKKDENDVFEIALLEFKQTNERGAHQWDKELIKIKDRLTFEVNAASGSPIKIMNRKEIEEKWHNVRPIMIKKYEYTKGLENLIVGLDSLLQHGKQLMKATAAATEHVLLLPGIYGVYNAEGIKSIRGRSIRSILPSLHLPVKATCYLEAYNEHTKACSLLIEGTPDYENFEKAKFKQAVKEMTQTFHAPTTMDVGYLEKYELDEYHWISSACRTYAYSLPGLIANETICMLTEEN